MLTIQSRDQVRPQLIEPKNARLRQALDLIQASLPDGSRAEAFLQLIFWLREHRQLLSQGEQGALFKLLEAINGAATLSPAVAAALAGSGWGARLYRRLEDLQDESNFLFFVDENGRPQLQRLQVLADGAKSAQLDVEETRSADLSNDKLVFTVNAKAALALGIDALTATAAQSKYATPVQGVGLALYASGELTGGIDLKQGSAALGLNAEAKHRLALLYQFDPQITTLAALDHVLGDVPADLSLAAIATALDLPGQSGLRQFSANSGRGFGFSLAGAVGFKRLRLRSVDALGAEQTISTSIDASWGLSVSYEAAGSRDLTVCRNAIGDIVIRAVSSNAQTAATKMTASAGIVIAGWEKIAGRLVAMAMPDAKPLLDRLAPFTEPGAWLQAELVRALPEDLQALAPLLTGGSTTAEAAAALVARVQALLQTRYDLWSASVEGGSNTLIEKLLNELLGGISQQHIAVALRAWLTDVVDRSVNAGRDALLENLETTLQGATGKLMAKPLKELTEQLGKVGVQVDKAAAAAADLVQPVIAFLRRYSALRARLLAAADKALKWNLQVKLEATWKQTSSDVLDIELILPAATAMAGTQVVERDFRRLLRGKPFANSLRPFDLPMASVQGNWKAVSERVTAIGIALTLDFGTLGVSASSLLESTTRIEVGPGGALFAQTRTSSKRNYAFGGESFSALGQAVFDALLAPNSGNGGDSLSHFSLDVALTDTRFKRKELDRLLASLRQPKAELISSTQAGELSNQWQALRDATGGDPAACLRLGLATNEGGRRQMLRTAASPELLWRTIVTAMVSACSGRDDRDVVAAFRLFGYANAIAATDFSGWVDFERVRTGGNAISIRSFNGVDIRGGGGKDPLRDAVIAIDSAWRPANAMRDAMQEAANWPLAEQLLAQKKLALTGAAHYDQRVATLIRDHYDALGTSFAANFNRALSANDVLFDRSDNVPVNTLFVLLLVRELTGSALLADIVPIASE